MGMIPLSVADESGVGARGRDACTSEGLLWGNRTAIIECATTWQKHKQSLVLALKFDPFPIDHKVKKTKRTYNSGYSPVVTHPSTNPPIRSLYKADRTRDLAFCDLWSYVDAEVSKQDYILGRFFPNGDGRSGGGVFLPSLRRDV